MTWETVTKNSRVDYKSVSEPIQFQRTPRSSRITLSGVWLESVGKEKSERITFYVDKERKMIAFSIIGSDLMNGYYLHQNASGNSNQIRTINATQIIEKAERFGYPLRTPLHVEQDKKDPNVWVIWKGGLKANAKA